MKARDSLRRRIAIAYLLFALGTSVFFAVIAVVAVEGIEVHLVDARLQGVADWAVSRHAGGLPVAMPAGLSFHYGEAIPVSLRGLPEGVGEVHVDGVDLHVLTGHDATGAYVLVDHESDYKKTEFVVYSMFGLGFIGFLLFSLFLGGFIGRRFVMPITTLAVAVRDGAAELPLQDRQDELGVLARAFAAHTSQLRGFLERERFFTGDVSHELRTPLTVITGAAEILIEQGAGNPAIQAPAERILRAANEAAACVNVLLTLARAPAPLASEQTDMAALAQAEVGRYHMLVAAKPVTLRYLGGARFSTAAPPELCAAALGNLIRNACQYTERGEVIVRLGPDSVIVEDTGPGLPAAVRASLLADRDATAPSGSAGTGLGLGLVKRICEYLGATMHWEERRGGGSVFEIRFTTV